MEQTLAIVKPGSLRHLGSICRYIIAYDLKILGGLKIHLTKEQAMEFYKEHENKGFYDPLTNYMSSNECMMFIIEGDYAISKWRELMGTTNPMEAAVGTVRFWCGEDLRHNAVHGSDSKKSAAREIALYYKWLKEQSEELENVTRGPVPDEHQY